MKCEIVIDPECEECVMIYAKKNYPIIEEIRNLTIRNGDGIFGYVGNEIVKLDPMQIQYITVVKNKVHAVCDDQRYVLKDRLYVLEELLPDFFVRINQSCLANITKMERFDTSISGTMKIKFKNGDIDYVSRRQLKTVKKRVGV